jgi:hypothetical protein
MLKKLEKREFQSISIILSKEEAIYLKHFQLLHLGDSFDLHPNHN